MSDRFSFSLFPFFFLVASFLFSLVMWVFGWFD
uniref:Uncharacterized protein n=1 Tax=Rhizophora mucronata TaxID=61149 RepID=A0A2P2P2L2_RHIMU